MSLNQAYVALVSCKSTYISKNGNSAAHTHTPTGKFRYVNVTQVLLSHATCIAYWLTLSKRNFAVIMKFPSEFQEITKSCRDVVCKCDSLRDTCLETSASSSEASQAICHFNACQLVSLESTCNSFLPSLS